MAKKTVPARKPAKKKPVPEEPVELEGDNEPRTTLFPGMKIPKDIAALARKMKVAELERKRAGAVEKDTRAELCVLMIKKDCKAFQMDVDGIDFEFNLEELTKVTSRRMEGEDYPRARRRYGLRPGYGRS